MTPLPRRLAVQYVVLALIAFLIVSLGCACYGGSSWSELFFRQRAIPQATPGVVDQWHDFKAESLLTTPKGVAFFRRWLDGNMAFAILVPQSADAGAPGHVAAQGNVILFVGTDVNHTQRVDVSLQRNDGLAEEVASILPSDDHHRWQVLEPVDYAFLQRIPDTLGYVEGTFHYRLEFGGTDRCNGCDVQLAFCARNMGELPALVSLALRKEMVQGMPLSCTHPHTAYILLEDPGAPAPPLRAAFGFYGGRTLSQHQAGEITIPLWLGHTGTSTLTFHLEAVQSARGWTYAWYNAAGTATISQIDVAPADPHGEHPPNLALKTTVPPCTSDLDLIRVRASAGDVVAEGYTYVAVHPDPSRCSLADIGVAHAAMPARVMAGDTITLTFTITNYETSPVGAVFTDTLSPADAIAGVLPGPGCMWQSPHLRCQIAPIGAKATRVWSATLTTSSRFTGTVRSVAQAEPTGAVDAERYDNMSGPWTISVYRTLVHDLYLPILTQAWR